MCEICIYAGKDDVIQSAVQLLPEIDIRIKFLVSSSVEDGNESKEDMEELLDIPTTSQVKSEGSDTLSLTSS